MYLVKKVSKFTIRGKGRFEADIPEDRLPPMPRLCMMCFI